jgi:predicted nicotinamide N-methyase
VPAKKDRAKKKTKPTIQHKFRGAIMPTGSHPAIRKAKRKGAQPSIHGTKLWKSSALLIDHMRKHPPEHCDTVIDVGCGWGLAGIWCARFLGSEVTSVDADPDVFPFLGVAAELNGVTTTPLVSRFEQLKRKQLRHNDMLIAADICFWDELVKPVTNMVNRAINAGVKRIMIADPERSTFLEMAERCLDRHGGELVEWRTKGSISARGSILIIDNA